MAKETRKSYLKRYKRELERACYFREQEGYDDLWTRMIDLYRGKHLPQVLSTEDRIVVAASFGIINVIYPSVSVNHPKITVSPTKPMDEERAVIVEAVTNYNWRHHNFQDQFRRAVKDYLILGHGWIKVGYRYKEGPKPLTEDEKLQEMTKMTGQADQYAADNPDMAGYMPTDEEIVAALPETNQVVLEDRPFVERVSPFDMFVDPEATCMEDIRWICQRIVRPLEDVRRDERYKRSVRLSVQADRGTGTTETYQRSWIRRPEVDDDNDRVTVYEWYDMRGNTMSVCAEGSDEFLIEPQAIPFPFGHPFVMLRNYDVPEYFYPMGDLEAIESLQYELNKLRSQQMQARKKFARKYLFRARAFDQIGRQALQSDEDKTLVPVADDNTPFDDLIRPLTETPVPAEMYNYGDLIEKDIGDVSGVSEYQKGQVPETRRTATEAAIISDSVNARAADKLAQIEGAIGLTARRVVAVLQEFVSQTQVASIVGPDGAVWWVPYDALDVAGEFDFEVEAGSTQPQNETVRRQTATSLMQAMAPFMEMGVINPQALAEYVLKTGFGVKDPGKFMAPPQPMLPPGMEDPNAQGGMPGQGGMQEPPMGGGYQNESGEVGNELPPDLTANFSG